MFVLYIHIIWIKKKENVAFYAFVSTVRWVESKLGSNWITIVTFFWIMLQERMSVTIHKNQFILCVIYGTVCYCIIVAYGYLVDHFCNNNATRVHQWCISDHCQTYKFDAPSMYTCCMIVAKVVQLSLCFVSFSWIYCELLMHQCITYVTIIQLSAFTEDLRAWPWADGIQANLKAYSP